jgi:two-component system chemotaxis sensor kinase CheA
MQQLMESFRQDLAERLASINAGLLALEQDPETPHQKEILAGLFRDVHSLKGAARAVDIKPIEELTHGIEDVFGAAKRASIQLTPELFDLLYHGLDLIGAVMQGIETGPGVDPTLDLSGYLVKLAQAWRGQPISPPPIETADSNGPFQQADPDRATPSESLTQLWRGETIRVPTDRLDDLMAQAGELLVTRLRATQQVEELKQLYAYIVRWQRDWKRVRAILNDVVARSGNGTGVQAHSFLEQSEERLSSLTSWVRDLTQRASDDATRLSLVTNELQDGVKRTRMLPLFTLLGTFRRIARDLAREKGVEVNLDVQNADTEMDKHILEQIQDPLMHLLRNCIDHGIEPPEERVEQGKPRRGTISLCAERRGNAIVIEVADDGRGIDIEAVRETAGRRGIVDPSVAAEMKDEQITALIFTSGLSTSPIITEVSGRGVGLDVVRKNVEALQGRTEVHSTPGKGTTFTLTLPLTLVSTRCLFVQVYGNNYAVPITAVERMLLVRPNDISIVEGKTAIRYQGRPLALVRLADTLQLENPTAASLKEEQPAVILDAAGQRIAFLVDQLLGQQDVVVKNLGRQLTRVPKVAGAAVLGTGKIALVLNVADLIKSAQRTNTQGLLPAIGKKGSVEKHQTILVVDDSITTRTLEKNILTTAGYEVRLATDGKEALATLSDNSCDLIVADVDMPHVDGFELTRQVKQDDRYQNLPVILVTSLESPEHKARGIEVGADAYIVKSTFDQDVLLDTIRQLI